MALIDRQREEEIGAELSRVLDEYKGITIGRARITTTQPLSNLTIFEQAYLAGKIADLVGPQRARRLGERELQELADRASLGLTVRDFAVIETLKDDTDGKVDNVLQRWKGTIGTFIARTNRAWEGFLRQGVDEQFVDERAKRLKGLNSLIEDSLVRMAMDVNRTTRNFLVLNFQKGQIANMELNTLVFKLPKQTACKTCMLLHLFPDGTPKLFTLGAIVENSNEGLPRARASFVVGPTHPFCYCTLHRVLKRVPGSSKVRARARKVVLR